MTARALELIATADVIVYDRLIPAAALARRPARRRADLRRQGGRRPVDAPGRDRAAAASSTARAGREVVRLKGGDPFVFGRGGEEAEALLRGRDPVRGRARGHRRRRGPRLRRDPGHPPRAGQRGRVRHRPRGPGQARVGARLGGARRASRARSSCTWACAGCRRSPQRLIAAGRAADEPAAVIERGTLPGQRVVAGTLATIACHRLGGGHPRARRSPCSARSRRSASGSPGSPRPRWPA